MSLLAKKLYSSKQPSFYKLPLQCHIFLFKELASGDNSYIFSNDLVRHATPALASVNVENDVLVQIRIARSHCSKTICLSEKVQSGKSFFEENHFSRGRVSLQLGHYFLQNLRCT